ncbi:hypothetical protein IT413_04365 [Candidatus Peregrinibacteria bacterium]|nr:hypothetical protein [Candidatus Peregrinibacteria bacterium]
MTNLNIHVTPPPEEYLHHPDVEKTQKLHQGTLFHGTGRLAKDYDDRDKSKPNGKTKDVLSAVLTEGLQPQADHIAKLILPITKTVSLTRQRIYARLYGEKFGENDQKQTHLEYTFGNHAEWWKYYIDECMSRGQNIRNARWLNTLHKNFKTRFTPEEARHWRDKDFHKARWFANKAAVAGNYPIIIGVDEKAVTPIELPLGLNDFEVRNGSTISPSSIKLVEVPNKKITEVRELVRVLGVTHVEILPIEVGEVASFQRGVAECAKGNFE